MQNFNLGFLCKQNKNIDSSLLLSKILVDESTYVDSRITE